MKKLNLFFITIVNLITWVFTKKPDERLRDLIYSPKEKILFYVSGYMNERNVINQGQYFREQAVIMLKASGLPFSRLKDVSTDYVDHSNRYKYMQWFYLKDVETCPADAFSLGTENGWTMWSWLHAK